MFLVNYESKFNMKARQCLKIKWIKEIGYMNSVPSLDLCMKAIEKGVSFEK